MKKYVTFPTFKDIMEDLFRLSQKRGKGISNTGIDPCNFDIFI